MRDCAQLARTLGVRLHTHLAETSDEEEFCLAHFGARPVDYVESLGWLGDDVWLAHCVHLSDGDIAKYAATGTGVAHCPSSNARLGSGIAPIPELLAARGAGRARRRRGRLQRARRPGRGAAPGAAVRPRARGPQALTARQALWMATVGGARCLGRSDAIGSLEVGKLGDLALWRIDGLGHADIADPVCALVFGPPAPLELLLVGGRAVVDGGELRTADVRSSPRPTGRAPASLRSAPAYAESMERAGVGIEDLYRERILEHASSPHNWSPPASPLDRVDLQFRELNPLCGDDLTVKLAVQPDGRILDVRFEGHGCAICQAAASMASDEIRTAGPPRSSRSTGRSSWNCSGPRSRRCACAARCSR